MNAKFQRPSVSEPVAGQTPEFHATDFVQTASVPRSGWRWIDLSLSLGLAGLLAWSWLWPRGRGIWNQVDATIFRFFNGALAFEWWRKGWAYLNHDYFDWVGMALYAGLLFYAGTHGRRSIRRGAVSVALLAIVVVGFQGGTHLAMKWTQGGLDRPSPTLANADAWRLSELVPTVAAKDASPWCFPSDHGFVVLAILLYLGYRGPDRAVRIAIPLSILFVVPRLVAGAHWFTDVAIGGGVLALVATGLLMATPLHDWALSRFDRGASALRQRTTSRLAQTVAAGRTLPRRASAPTVSGKAA